jgi:hypothetical protein
VFRQEDAQEQAGRSKNLITCRKKKLKKKRMKNKSREFGEGRNMENYPKVGQLSVGVG